MARKPKKPQEPRRSLVVRPNEAPLSKAQQEADRRLDEQLAETFPASDPPSILRRN